MQTGQLILILLLILLVAVVVFVVLRRRSAKREAQRVEAAALRVEADTIAARVSGLSTFAEQAQDRAELARVEAEEKARDAARLEAEAAERRAAADDTRREYEAAMRRADDVDPDVKESSFAPADTVEGVPEEDGAMTRSEHREARERSADADADADAPAVDPAAAPGAVAAAASASAWADRDDEERAPESERIASAADFRDDMASDGAADAVYPVSSAGTGTGMSDESRPVTPQPTSDAVHDDDLTRDAESPRGEWGGPPEDADADADADAGADAGADEGADGTADMAIVAEPEDYAATEPVLAADQTPPVEREPVAAEDPRDGQAPTDASATTDETSVDRSETRDTGDPDGGADRPAVIDDVGAYAATEPVMAGESTPATASGDQDRDHDVHPDPTPTRDWAADEGDLLDESHHRADRLAEERAELDRQSAATASAPVGEHGAAVGDEPAAGEGASRRISEFHELRDGGFGVGSAAPLDDRAQPLDHPVQAYRDTMTFRAPGDAGYDSAEPDVWFYDVDAAERSGFRRAEG